MYVSPITKQEVQCLPPQKEPKRAPVFQPHSRLSNNCNAKFEQSQILLNQTMLNAKKYVCFRKRGGSEMPALLGGIT